MDADVYDLSKGWNRIAAEMLYAGMADGTPG